MSSNFGITLKKFCFRFSGTMAILILSVVFDMKVFNILEDPVSVIYALGFIGFGALVLGIIISIWE